MQLTGRGASPSNVRENVIFNSLSLDGTSGKVRATVDERMLCIESKTGHALDIKISSINRVHHHPLPAMIWHFQFPQQEVELIHHER